MIGNAAIELFTLFLAEEKLISILGDTVPESFDEFETLRDGELAEIVDRDAHTGL